jgi:prepilin-type N-terminal cleavage/methylation domain-containing protein
MKRGFTLIELVIVMVIIGILAGVLIFNYSAYEKRSFDGEAKSIAATVKSAAERYYTRNNEYPSAQTLYGSTPSCTVAPNYQTVSNTLDIPIQTINASHTSLRPYAGADCTWDTTKVYYITKTSTDGTSVRTNTLTSCTYTFPATDNGSASFLIFYYSNQDGYWHILSSNYGDVSNTGASCAFTQL